MSRNKSKKTSKCGFKSSQEKQQIRKDITTGRSKTTEQAMGSNDLESYCQRKSQDLIKEHSSVFGVGGQDNIFPAWFQNYYGPVTAWYLSFSPFFELHSRKHIRNSCSLQDPGINMMLKPDGISEGAELE